MRSPFAAVKKFVTDLVLWICFAGGLTASAGAGAVIDDNTQKNIATGVGAVVALLAGARIAKKPKIKAFLGRPGTLWFLFLFNGGTAVAMYLTMDGIKGILAAAMMGVVSLGAAGGLVAGRRKRAEAEPIVSGRV
ncbi:hypothetical protein GCM10022403_043210 [Streptomyces coacervatus]|uniref:Integral membrane protein n=1 Tax=Streptomyces coacervatus TaxID=647381 RepID=A0ABP7HYS1_9ACTN|nr:hypothetical protein [Streptomyces coacervatus]MDF2267100.1 hypothetical protein [Streptomyces coacervatus]